MRTQARTLLGCALAAGAALAGCSSTPPHELTTTGADESVCENLLSGEAMQQLTGEQGAFGTKELSELPTCQALIDSEAGSRVSVVRVPAADWAATATQKLGYLAGTGQAGEYAAEIDQLVGTAQAGDLTGPEACTMFGLLAELEHDSPAETSLVVASSSRGGLEVMTAQACAEGDYTMVELESMDDWGDEDAVRDSLIAAVEELNPDATLTG